MVPLELESSTEKDSRMLWRSWGGSLERLSLDERPLETSRRCSLGGIVFVVWWSYLVGEEDKRCVVGDGGGSVCARRKDDGSGCLEGVDMTISSSSSSSDTV